MATPKSTPMPRSLTTPKGLDVGQALFTRIGDAQQKYGSDSPEHLAAQQTCWKFMFPGLYPEMTS